MRPGDTGEILGVLRDLPFSERWTAACRARAWAHAAWLGQIEGGTQANADRWYRLLESIEGWRDGFLDATLYR